MSFQAIQYNQNQRMFLSLIIEAVMFLFFCPTEARHVLRMFLIFDNFEPQRSYKHGSYSRKSVYNEGGKKNNIIRNLFEISNKIIQRLRKDKNEIE